MKISSISIRCLFVCLLIQFFITDIHSQDKIKYGKIDPADLKMTFCSFDSSADAMVLGDIGQTYFNYDDQEGFTMVFERLIRIKIFTKKGYSKANIEIPYYHSDKEQEKITTLKAKIYNLEKGKIVETKVSEESIFDEETDAYWKIKKVTFPAVREGSVVELKYAIKSTILANLRDWYFQCDIPIKWSEYEVRIPQFYHYSRLASGFFPFVVNETSTSRNKINRLNTNYNNSGGGASAVIRDASIDYTDNVFRLATKNVPAFKEEPYATSMRNYLSKTEFAFNGYQFPDQAQYNVNSTWEEIVENLLNDEDFGGQLKKGGLVKEIANEIIDKTKEPRDRMILAFEYIAKTMKWNEYCSKYPTTNLRKALQNRVGNSADINLSLTLLLRELGLSADPVILSTRKHGIVSKAQPSLFKMNYVITLVTIDGNEYLLDATNRQRPYTMLPFQCLNGEGLVVSKEKMRWIPLLQGEKDNTFYFADLKILPQGEIKGKIEISKSGYFGLEAREKFISEGNENYKKSLRENLKSWTVDEVSWENMETLMEDVKCIYTVSTSELIQVSDNMIYLNALLNMGQEYNPFQQEKRNYPVDFGCPLKDGFVFNYEIPEGYKVVSVPENFKLSLPDQAGTYKFIVGMAGNKISVSSQLSITKPSFFQPDYAALRDFFNTITTKHGQQIVLKKS